MGLDAIRQRGAHKITNERMKFRADYHLVRSMARDDATLEEKLQWLEVPPGRRDVARRVLVAAKSHQEFERLASGSTDAALRQGPSA